MSPNDLKTHLLTLEGALQTSEVRGSEARLKELLAQDFREFGRSGGRYCLSDILADLLGETATPKTTIEDFRVALLSESIALATYRGVRLAEDGGGLATNRSSIWRLEPDGSWRMVFHQGTPAA
jgi:hypothetical protein